MTLDSNGLLFGLLAARNAKLDQKDVTNAALIGGTMGGSALSLVASNKFVTEKASLKEAGQLTAVPSGPTSQPTLRQLSQPGQITLVPQTQTQTQPLTIASGRPSSTVEVIPNFIQRNRLVEEVREQVKQTGWSLRELKVSNPNLPDGIIVDVKSPDAPEGYADKSKPITIYVNSLSADGPVARAFKLPALDPAADSVKIYTEKLRENGYTGVIKESITGEVGKEAIQAVLVDGEQKNVNPPTDEWITASQVILVTPRPDLPAPPEDLADEIEELDRKLDELETTFNTKIDELAGGVATIGEKLDELIARSGNQQPEQQDEE